MTFDPEEPGPRLTWSAVICEFSRYGATGWIGDGVIPKFSRYVITAGGGCTTISEILFL